MLRHIMIISAVAVTALALATGPAGAGAGNLHVYSAPNFGGTHASVPSTTVDDYLGACVATSTLTSSVVTAAQSAQNDTSFDLKFYGAANCDPDYLIVTVNANSTWSASSSQSALSIFVIEPSL